MKTRAEIDTRYCKFTSGNPSSNEGSAENYFSSSNTSISWVSSRLLEETTFVSSKTLILISYPGLGCDVCDEMNASGSRLLKFMVWGSENVSSASGPSFFAKLLNFARKEKFSLTTMS